MANDYSDRWKVIEDLPQGGQAYVHKVVDKTGKLEGEFVVKRLINPKRLARFRDEVSTLSELDHSGIVRLVDFDVDAERPWFVQEFCEGGDLQSFVDSGQLDDPPQAFEFFVQLCDALAYAHANSRVHRDVKPANIFLRGPDGPMVLGDFGLTFRGDDKGDRITLTHEQVGPRFYMAPELREGRLEDPTWRCDIYSLGKVLYFMLTNGEKFDRENFDDEDHDVVKLTGNAYLEHANNLFSKMITFDPEARSTAEGLGEEADLAGRLVGEGHPSLTGRHISPCKYCGIGTYVPVASNLAEYGSFFGFSTGGITTGANGLRAMACNHCGHIQMFKMRSPKYDWWPGTREDD